MDSRDENKNQIESVNESDSKDVSGGFYGSDWLKCNSRTFAYKEFGISHEKNIFGKDKYFLAGKELPKKFVHEMMDTWVSTNDLCQLIYVEKQIVDLRHEIEAGHSDMLLKHIWKKYG